MDVAGHVLSPCSWWSLELLSTGIRPRVQNTWGLLTDRIPYSLRVLPSSPRVKYSRRGTFGVETNLTIRGGGRESTGALEFRRHSRDTEQQIFLLPLKFSSKENKRVDVHSTSCSEGLE